MSETTTEQAKRGVARVTGSQPVHPEADYRRRAVLYVRVSSAGQTKTDRDGEGFSIAAQRDAGARKAAALGAEVVEIYVDAAESARKADRPQLQAMLERLRQERDIDYVIVHKVDRLARNRGDDVAITLAIRQAGAQLVSVTENIDETPQGMLLHGIMSSIAEFYSNNLATEVAKGTLKKAERGIFPALAPVGYINRQDFSGGNKLRWIETDAERAPLVSWAFEVYASGDYSLQQLTEALADRGLTTRGSLKRPAKSLVLRHVHKLLSNRFYLGMFSWGGVEYQGTHEPLVTIETFATVQAIMQARRHAGDKPQKHPHYLKGTIFCARCGSRMLFSRNRGRQGSTYDYFACIGRHTHGNGCTLPYLPVEEVEEAFVQYYRTFALSDETAETIRTHLLRAAKRRNATAERLAKRERKRILELEAERRRLLQAHLAGAVPLELLKEEQARMTAELANAGAALANTEVHWETMERNLAAALQLTTRLGEAYELATPTVRRYFNQAVFESVGVDVDGRIVYARTAEPFKSFYDQDLVPRLEQEIKSASTAGGRGSNIDGLVELTGLEPATYWLQTSCSTN